MAAKRKTRINQERGLELVEDMHKLVRLYPEGVDALGVRDYLGVGGVAALSAMGYAADFHGVVLRHDGDTLRSRQYLWRDNGVDALSKLTLHQSKILGILWALAWRDHEGGDRNQTTIKVRASIPEIEHYHGEGNGAWGFLQGLIDKGAIRIHEPAFGHVAHMYQLLRRPELVNPRLGYASVYEPITLEHGGAL